MTGNKLNLNGSLVNVPGLLPKRSQRLCKIIFTSHTTVPLNERLYACLVLMAWMKVESRCPIFLFNS